MTQKEQAEDLEQNLTELAIELSDTKDIEEINHIYNRLKSWLSANRMVRLDPDQSLPESPFEFGRSQFMGYEDAQQNMLNAGFKKVKK